LNDNEIKKYDDVFVYLDQTMSNWEKVITDDQVKIKTNQVSVHFTFVEKILQKFNMIITDISYNDYYGIIIGIKKLE
jgi:hypothetical protein|tara:strand:+ start:273 stop:503 length:231 start_codon:yes stop_codon:yes gene_type:complete